MKKLANYRPILFFSLALILGGYLFVYALFHEYIYIIIGSIVFLALFLGVIFWLKSKDNKLFTRIIACGVLPFVLGGVVASCSALNKMDEFKTYGDYYVTATIAEGGAIDGYYEMTLTDVELRQNADSSSYIKLKGEYTLFKKYFGEVPISYVGDRISFYGTYIYEYDKSLEINVSNASYSKGAIKIYDAYTIDERGSGVRYNILRWTRDTIFNNMDYSSAVVGYGMLFGDDTLMIDDIKEMYSAAGVSHLLAVSGLHVGFLIAILGWALSKIIKNKWAYLLTAVSLLIGYAYICNWTPSVIRAVSMFGVGGLASRTFRQYDGLNSLAVASIVNFIFMPLDIFHVGFLLSYSVVFSIFAISPIFSRILDKKMPKKIASALSLSVSAWLGSIPVILFYFESVSIYAVIINLLVIPFASVIFSVLLISLAVGAIPFLASFMLAIPEFLIFCLNFMVVGFGSLSTSVVNFSIGYPILLFGVVTLILSGDYVFIKRKPALAAVLVFGFIGFMTIYNF